MNGFPRTPAAFINAIAEEGTKAEAVEYLQKTWDELCAIRRGDVVCVPREPTDAMIAAAYDIHPCGATDNLTRAYKAMIAAAPKP